MEVFEVSQGKLSDECWSVQIRGLKACKDCEFSNTEDCGGKEIRKTGKNSKGYPVPVTEFIGSKR